ncbi:DUF305 domain-containing protein [Hamadaea tsunoensis]|uniref:DUF305 domain-containing protein n=1 Tax=Hamadaea tsunoensis TaxID=53368 RepID=UPI0003FE5AAE|nr:DUF305 domain-containing protein [Hamadaea tsunoensis]
MKKIAALALLLLSVSGCAAQPTPDTGTQAAASLPARPSASRSIGIAEDGSHNATDVMFLQMMAAQYAPADKLLELAASHSTNEQVKQLAAAIKVTQADEYKQVQAWLTGWGKPLAPDSNPALHAEHGGLPATGQKEIDALAQAAPADFDREFLNLLLGHQHQAVEYARMELTSGVQPQVLEFATRIDSTRSGEIPMMLKLVG